MQQDNDAADHHDPEDAVDSPRPSDFDQAVRAQAHRLLTEAHRELEELGYIGPHHRDRSAGARCWSADGHRPADTDEPDA